MDTRFHARKRKLRMRMINGGTMERRIHNCPCCGEILNSFVSNCPCCGYELRGDTATSSVTKIYEDLSNTVDSEQRNFMIRNFPIPNTKEDIVEFMLLASSNMVGDESQDIFEAWVAKIEQCYKKALLSFKNDNDIRSIQQIYDECQTLIVNEREKKVRREIFEMIVRNIAVCAGLLLLVVAIQMDRFGGNASMLQLVSYIILMASAATLAKRKAGIIDYVFAVGSGLFTMASTFLFHNGSMAQLCGGFVLIFATVNYFRSIVSKK